MTSSVLERLRQLTEVGIALSAQKDNQRLLEQILVSAKAMTNADGGTLYLRTDDDRLRFVIMLTDSLNLCLGGTNGGPIAFSPLPLYDDSGRPNRTMVASYAAVEGRTVNIADAYEAEEFDFSGTRAFDEKTGYRSRSFLTVPMRNHENNIIGVLQLINARRAETGEVVSFSEEDQQVVESLSSQAAVALTNKRLIDAQRRLFESFIELIAGAIDDKSPYTGGHCRRVPELTMMLADAAAATRDGPLEGFSLTEDDRYELKIAGWLHDCGKITTPEYVVDKSTKLETICDRIDLVDVRFEVLKRDAEIRLLKAKLAGQGNGADLAALEREHEQELHSLEDERQFLERSNIGTEEMSVSDRDRVRQIGQRTWRAPDGAAGTVLTEDEVYNLTVPRGTLTPEERDIIDHHIVATIKMLESLPYPSYLEKVPEYAGGHHEKMDGTGYPRGLVREQMSVPARVMAIADIFEALTAKDRPYKDGMKLSEALQIMGRMKLNNHIDPDLFDVFVRDKVYLRYAEKFLDPAQIDSVDETQIPGYVPPGPSH